jgi:hypothetical protein
MRILYLLLLLCVSSNLTACNSKKSKSLKVAGVSNSNSSSKTDSMKLKITVGDKVISAILNDNATTRDFISLLPLTLTLTDYNRTEKISDLPNKLSTKDAPAGYKPSVGDITLYAPWGNLAIFYKDFSYSNGLISLGKITSGIEVLNVSGPLKARIELDNN